MPEKFPSGLNHLSLGLWRQKLICSELCVCDELALGDKTADGIMPNALQAVLLLWIFKCSGMWSCVHWGAPDISKVYTAYIFRGSTPKEDSLRLL